METANHLHNKHNTMSNSKCTRRPSVSGLFYPSHPKELTQTIDRALENELDCINLANISGNIAGGIVPHAGMVYCARQTVHFFEHYKRSGQKLDTVVIIHPNHKGYGPRVSIDGYERWETPLGIIEIDVELAHALNLPVSPEAQEGEHSAEVIVPYLQYFIKEKTRIVSVNILDQTPDTAKSIAHNLYTAAQNLNRRVLVIASSDFSHFLPPDKGSMLDELVVQQILQHNTDGVYQTVTRHGISVCGYGPIMALMEYTKLIHPEYKVHVLRKGHSGEVSPSDKVVCYISLLFETNI